MRVLLYLSPPDPQTHVVPNLYMVGSQQFRKLGLVFFTVLSTFTLYFMVHSRVSIMYVIQNPLSICFQRLRQNTLDLPLLYTPFLPWI